MDSNFTKATIYAGLCFIIMWPVCWIIGEPFADRAILIGYTIAVASLVRLIVYELLFNSD